MEQNSLFQNDVQKDPLAARLRPASLQDYVGQKHLLGKGKILYNLIEKDMVSSMIFWGPPGVGKTTLARIIARQTQAHFINFSAVTSGIREIKAVMKEAEDARLYGRKTIVFVDEIHRFNKAQQDAFLPYVEKGMDVECIKIDGSVELAPILGLCDGIVDIMETGTTLKENGLVVFDTVCDISARVIVNKASFKLKRAEILAILEDMKKGLEAC